MSIVRFFFSFHQYWDEICDKGEGEMEFLIDYKERRSKINVVRTAFIIIMIGFLCNCSSSIFHKHYDTYEHNRAYKIVQNNEDVLMFILKVPIEVQRDDIYLIINGVVIIPTYGGKRLIGDHSSWSYQQAISRDVKEGCVMIKGKAYTFKIDAYKSDTKRWAVEIEKVKGKDNYKIYSGVEFRNMLM
jgi:hypothetical protein